MIAATLLSVPVFAAGFKAASFPHETAGASATPVRTTAASPNQRPSAPAVRYRGLTAREWARRYRVRTRQYQSARYTLTHRPDVVEALQLACTAYKTSCARVYWIAHCESTLNPNAKNASEASGLGQFIDSTWASTPYARFSVFSPLANALAIAYEVSLGNSTVHWFASKSCWSAHS